MIIITREYTKSSLTKGCERCTEFKAFADDDVDGVQKYLDEHIGTFVFKRL